MDAKQTEVKLIGHGHYANGYGQYGYAHYITTRLEIVTFTVSTDSAMFGRIEKGRK